MQFEYKPDEPARRLAGIAIVVVLHVLVAYALLSGLAHKAVEVIKRPLEATVIQEVKIPPPPPPKPRIIRPPQAPKVQAPPPPFVPPPDVRPPPVDTPPITVTTPTPPPEPAVIQPPPPPTPDPPKPTARADIGVACPTQVKPEMPRKALQDGSGGIVRAQALIEGGQVREVTILSGPRVFHAAVRAAMAQYRCVAADGTLATQEFEFKVE